MVYANVPCWIREAFNRLKTEGMYDEAVRMEPRPLGFVPNHLRTQAMCNEAVRREPYRLLYVPDHLITQEMCEEAMRVRPATFFLIPDRFKTQEMCIRAVRGGPWNLRHVPDSFVTQQQIKIWHDDVYYCNNDKLIKWYEGYQKRKTQKANKRRASAHCLASQSCDGLVYVRGREQVVEVIDNWF